MDSLLESEGPRSGPFGRVAWRRFLGQLVRIQPFALVIQACAVGVITGGGAILYSELISLIQWCALGSTDLPLYLLPHLPWYRVLFTPMLGGILVACVIVFLA